MDVLISMLSVVESVIDRLEVSVLSVDSAKVFALLDNEQSHTTNIIAVPSIMVICYRRFVSPDFLWSREC